MQENTSRSVYQKATEIILSDMKNKEVGFNHLRFLLLKEAEKDVYFRTYFIQYDGSFNYHVLSRLLQDLGFRRVGWHRWKRINETLPKVLR